MSEQSIHASKEQMGANPEQVHVTHEPLVIPTYEPYPPDKNPIFHEKRSNQGASGRVYPLSVTDRLGHEKKDKAWDCYTLENEFIKVQVLPEIGGRIHMGLDKTNGYHFVYHNQVIKPALIGIAGSWCSGGIEFNWPQHHRPTTFSPVESSIEESADGSRTVWTGETEPLYRTKAMAGITINPGRSWLKVKVRAYNPTQVAQPFMWWANLGVHVNEDYRINFPPDIHQVAFHDRASVTTWPVLTGKYSEHDFGAGVDASWYKNLKAAGSFMAMDGDSQYDFVQGYDMGKQAGTIHVADHHVSPGKKLFTWGTNHNAQAWYQNLTDEDGPYVELMTGMYTDNQPDFSWLQPDETRTFEHCWYPIRQIGLVKNATEDAAVSLERTEGGLKFGFHATGRFNGCRAVVQTADGLSHTGRILFDSVLDIAPDRPFVQTISLPFAVEPNSLSICLTDAEGRVLVNFNERDVEASLKKTYPVTPARTATPDPQDVATIEELYFYAVHLEQYRHHSFEPECWYLEALRRDPGDSRCNKAMGLICLKQGRLLEAENYLKTALKRQTQRNTHPSDGETSYLLGVVMRLMGRDSEAYDRFAKADWNFAWQSVSRLEMAELSCKAGRLAEALVLVDRALSVSAASLRGWNLKIAILRHMGRMADAEKVAAEAGCRDPLNLRARWEKGLLLCAADVAQGSSSSQGKSALDAIAQLLSEKPEVMMDIALGYIAAGMRQDALTVLERLSGYPTAICHHAALLMELGRVDEAKRLILTLEQADVALARPNRVEDIRVLRLAMTLNPQGALAPYALGNFCYDRKRHEEAILLWEDACRLKPTFAGAHRNLAIALFDKHKDAAGARLEMKRAFEADPTNARLLYELVQLLKNADDHSHAERLALVESHKELVAMRSDFYVDWMILLLQACRLDEAAERILAREFDIYEGGEGRVVRVYEWICILRGLMLLEAGEPEKAMQEILRAETVPLSFHEGRNQHAYLSHIYYFAAKAAAACGKTAEAEALYEKASGGTSAITDMMLYKGLSMRAIGRYAEADKLFVAMLEAGSALVKKGGHYDHFGTGIPTPAPFEGDRGRRNISEGLLLQALGHSGLREVQQASAKLQELMVVQANHLGGWVHSGKCGVNVLGL